MLCIMWMWGQFHATGNQCKSFFDVLFPPKPQQQVNNVDVTVLKRGTACRIAFVASLKPSGLILVSCAPDMVVQDAAMFQNRST